MKITIKSYDDFPFEEKEHETIVSKPENFSDWYIVVWDKVFNAKELLVAIDAVLKI